MARKRTAKAEAPTFEKRLERLEAIVEKLEGGEAGLDESLKLYAEGAELIKACRAALAEAERHVAKLTETAAGDLVEEPLDADEAEPQEDPAS